ncbi:L-threonylcarbamoyladenylate synthase [Methanolapillus millepedarum]|uniref:L-threonylcarbamoyladenylate synthase n=1 Tax=Methanolapillus millepedarum TaxID=3028296 RepID=A0AA96V3H0_9EURY|nr:Threonylcarbamoyl-AMP synthase [Methanosarcinaceae archaeon Ac7]
MTFSKTIVFPLSVKEKPNPADRMVFETVIEHAAAALMSGQVIAFPTDTVYGLGASVFDAKAVEKIYQIKERPSEKPLSVLIGSADDMKQIAADVPAVALLLAEKFWPGPLTIILNKNSKIPDNVTCGKKTVGLRVPNHPVALSLIQKTGPLACPSANLSGKKDPKSAADVLADLDGKIDILIDGGETKIQISSTIIDLTENPPKILRQGGLSIESIKECIGDLQ